MCLPLGFVIILLLLSGVFMKKKLRIYAITLAVFIYVLSINPTAELFIRPLEDTYRPASLAEVATVTSMLCLAEG